MQTKFYSEPFMSGVSPLGAGVWGEALAYSVSLFWYALPVILFFYFLLFIPKNNNI